MPNLIVLAGPNGAGKSTFYASFLEATGLPFVNADVLAKELELGDYEAANLAEEKRHRYMAAKVSFITETVFSDPVGAKLQTFCDAVDSGYNVTLFYIGLESPSLSKARVSARVEKGGHNVPAEKLLQRYARTLENLSKAIKVLPRVVLFDNSTPESPHRFIAEFRDGKITRSGEGPVPEWARPFVSGT